jgi:hypothetical protein
MRFIDEKSVQMKPLSLWQRSLWPRLAAGQRRPAAAAAHFPTHFPPTHRHRTNAHASCWSVHWVMRTRPAVAAHAASAIGPLCCGGAAALRGDGSLRALIQVALLCAPAVCAVRVRCVSTVPVLLLHSASRSVPTVSGLGPPSLRCGWLAGRRRRAGAHCGGSPPNSVPFSCALCVQ